jgi:hypothetical protein
MTSEGAVVGEQVVEEPLELHPGAVLEITRLGRRLGGDNLARGEVRSVNTVRKTEARGALEERKLSGHFC